MVMPDPLADDPFRFVPVSERVRADAAMETLALNSPGLADLVTQVVSGDADAMERLRSQLLIVRDEFTQIIMSLDTRLGESNPYYAGSMYRDLPQRDSGAVTLDGENSVRHTDHTGEPRE